MRGLRVHAGGVQRRGQPRPPAGELPAQGRRRQARQLPQGRLLAPPAPGGTSRPKAGGEFPDLVRHYRRADKLWSGSYFAGSVGGPRSRFCASTSSGKTDRLKGLKENVIIGKLIPAGTGFRVEEQAQLEDGETEMLPDGESPEMVVDQEQVEAEKTNGDILTLEDLGIDLTGNGDAPDILLEQGD